MMNKNFWTGKRTERVINLYGKYASKEGCFRKISNTLKTKKYTPTPNAVYKKLGRLGVLPAKWSQMERMSKV